MMTLAAARETKVINLSSEIIKNKQKNGYRNEKYDLDFTKTESVM